MAWMAARVLCLALLVCVAAAALKYDVDAFQNRYPKKLLESHIERHKALTAKANTLLKQIGGVFAEKGMDYALEHLDEIPEEIRSSFKLTAGGHLNYEMFFSLLNPNKSELRQYRVVMAINAVFKDMAGFETEFQAVVNKVAGTGWAWLVFSHKDRKVSIKITTQNDRPVTDDLSVLLTFPILKDSELRPFKKSREGLLKDWLSLVDWKMVNDVYYHGALLREKVLSRARRAKKDEL